MDWILRGVSARAELAGWMTRPFSAQVEQGPRPCDRRDHHERLVCQEEPGLPQTHGAALRLADAILRFDVFPPGLITGILHRQPVEVGDTVGLLYHFLPGLDLFFAARVMDRFAGEMGSQWRCGFTYRTLEGHPECGEETFMVSKDLVTGKVTVALSSWSRPGLWLTRMTYPVMRRMQVRAVRMALDHLEQQAFPLEPAQEMHSHLTPARMRRDGRTGLLRSDERW